MIRISCTSCKAILTVDDAFAGGVCRCQHCGTIQVVPANLKPGSAKSPGAKTSSAAAQTAGVGSGIATATAAGAATASLPQKTSPPAKTASHLDGNLLKLGVIIAFILFLLLIAVIFIFMREA